QLGKLILALHQVLYLFGLQSRPLIMLENGGIANLAHYGGSRDRYGSLPTDFGDVEGTKRGEKVEWPHEVDAPNVENLANLDGILRHFITLQNHSLTLTSIKRFNQVVGITIDCGPIESEIKHLLGSVVRAMMSPGGSIMAILENVNGFLAVNTPPDDLIRTYFKPKGVVPKVMLHVFEEFVFLLGRHSLNNEVPRMEENPSEQSRLGIFLSKEVFSGGVIRIHYAFVQDEVRLEQHFLMTDYSLWEVILNGDSPIPTRVVEDAKTLMEAIEKQFRRNTKTKKVQKTLLKQQYENFTGSSSEGLDQIHDIVQKLVSQLEIHEVSLSKKDVNLKFLRSFPSEWKIHTLIWRNKADLEDQSLDDLFNSLKFYETEVKHSSSTVSAASSISVVCAKLPVSSLPNIDVDDLEEMDLRWQMAMLAMRARRFLQKTGKNLGDNGPTYMGFDMSKVECYNCHRKGHFARECRSPKDSRRPGSYDWSYQAEEEPANYALMSLTSSSSSSDNETNEKHGLGYFSSKSDYESCSPSSLSDRFQPSGEYHVVPPPITGTFMPPKPDLVFHTAPIAVETNHSTFTGSDSEDESETKAPQIVPSFVQSFEQVKTPRHFVQPIETSIPTASPKPTSLKSNRSGTRRNRKTCFVCKSVDHLIKDCDYHAKKMAQPTPRNYAHRGNNKQNASLTHKNSYKHMVPAAVLTQSNLISITTVRPVSAAVPKIMVTRPRLAHLIVTKSNSPIISHITHSPSPKTSNSPPRVTVAQAPVVSAAQGMQGKWGNPQYALKDKGVIYSGCSRHMIGNMSYLSKFKELNGGYVAFGGNPKGGKIFGKGKI
nr:hypothetical protein [Tanacetum cinerariifolium]